MTSEDFVRLARHIAKITDPLVRLQAAAAVACACKESNPRFDMNLFYDACDIVRK